MVKQELLSVTGNIIPFLVIIVDKPVQCIMSFVNYTRMYLIDRHIMESCIYTSPIEPVIQIIGIHDLGLTSYFCGSIDKIIRVFTFSYGVLVGRNIIKITKGIGKA